MNAVECLQVLGSTPGEVAASLEARGIKGHKRKACRCPLSNYLKAQGFELPIVGKDTVITGDGIKDLVSLLPPACSAFVTAFDDGNYPELVES